MQPIANEKCDEVGSAAVQKQPWCKTSQKYYAVTTLIFCHALMILSMHLREKAWPCRMILHDSNLDPALLSHIVFLTLLGSVYWWINNRVAIKKALHFVLVMILGLISFVMGVYLYVMRLWTLPDSVLSEEATCHCCPNLRTWCSYLVIISNSLEILTVFVEPLSILVEGTVILVAFAWWRLIREMKVPSKSP